MGLPTIDIVFRQAAKRTIAQGQKGTVAVIVKDGTEKVGGYVIRSKEDIPSKLNQGNQGYVSRTLLGYVNAPSKVLLYVLPSAAENFTDALAWLATQSYDYLVAPPDITEEQCASIVTWIRAQRALTGRCDKAVLPHTAADYEGIINFTTDGIVSGGTTYDAGGYCSRIAGLIAGTPMTISCTYAPLSEVSDIERLTQAEANTAIDGGEFILIHDGEKVKVGRGVTSLTTASETTGETLKKIKALETCDRINVDLVRAIQDSYIGRCSNSYDDKCLLMTYIKSYLKTLEDEKLLRAGSSTVEIDMAGQKKYLREQDMNVDGMSDQEIKEANTGSHVFLVIFISLLDAMEDVAIIIDL